MINEINNKSPLSYADWVGSQGYYADISQQAYYAYLNAWYRTNDKYYNNNNSTLKTRQQYIQLIKDLLHFFNADEEKDLFLTDIDFDKDDDLMYIIPYLAAKLKQFSQIISEKREEIKRSKLKQQMVGSSEGLEKILYEYVLRNFTNKPYSWTRVPISPLQNQFPQLSSINKDFYIEIEELHDTNSYHDSDPSVPISEYFDLDTLLNKEPFSSMSNEELADMLRARFLVRVAETPLSKVFEKYLSISPQLSSTALLPLSSNYKKSVYNQIAANQIYLGESLYGLTAIRTSDLNIPDGFVSLNITQGNNWFYWPSGDKGPDPKNLGNIFTPIPINQSNLVLGRSVSGSNYSDSDLIFTNKDGVLYGAWLQGYRMDTENDTMRIIIDSNDWTEFIFPWVGFTVNSKDFSFGEYVLNDSYYEIFQKLDPTIRSNLLRQYYNNTLPNSASYDVYLNQTSLVSLSANAGYTSDMADTITVIPSATNSTSWNDALQGPVQQAYLYKFDKTDIYIPNGITDIIWPIESFMGGTDNLSVTLSADTCLPVNLESVDPSRAMVGSVAGQSFGVSDIIYKLNQNGGNATEAAWLGSGSITQLDQLKNAIPVYQTSAVNCAQYIDGPIQPALSLTLPHGEYTSFIWCDEDTPADDVFRYFYHESTCPYGATFPHNFYADQEYQNPSPLNEGNKFPLNLHPCTCGAVNWSPIGTQGSSPTDYNNMGDLLFADPQGLGSDFNYVGWVDTRNFNAFKSPQFSFYQINGNKDKDVGFGNGKWVTGNGKPMILKTGRRYTYYRSSMRINGNNKFAAAPDLYVKYAYKSLNVTCGMNFSGVTDLVILIDNSRTQKFDIDLVKSMVTNICKVATESAPDVLVSIISFNEEGLVLNYLTNDYGAMLKSINQIKTPATFPEWLTNIADGLRLANNVLYVNQPQDNECFSNGINDLCKGLQSQIVNYGGIPTITNCPRLSANKTIVMFSDGQETVNSGVAVPYAQLMKQNKNLTIYGVDIGYYALTDNVVENISSPNCYYNLEKYLNYSDIDLNRFTEILTALAIGCYPSVPAWCKATRGNDGNWIGLDLPSDMVLNPGDYLAYVHRNTISYVGETTNSSFTNNAISFTVNVKLDGWSYDVSKFSTDFVGEQYGAKPFWGNYVTSVTGLLVGGGARVADNYVILHQPEVSEIVLSNGNYVRYQNYGNDPIKWNQDLTFNVVLTAQQWNKLNITKTDSNYSSILDTNNIQDYIIESTSEPSDIMLESYSTLNAAKYYYYLAPQNLPFTYNEPLYYINRCNSSFVTFVSGMILEATLPYANLDNIHYPTVANIAFPSTFVTESDTGFYMLPSNLGVPYYRGRGYDIQLDQTSLPMLNALSAEYIFSDPAKYGPRNRGLTKKDQLAPLFIKTVDNRWMYEPYGSGNMAGTPINMLDNQKMVPYQSNYEINPNNQIGVSLQKDDFEFWNPDFYNLWNDSKNYPLTFRNEIIFNNFLNKFDTLLTNIGNESNWKSDIYGNNFGLYKYYDNSVLHYFITENNKIMISEIGLKLETE